MTAVLLVAVPRLVLAGDSNAEAERLIKRGIELRKAYDDEGAVREFRKAYDLAHSPRAAGQLGLAEQALGRWEDAEQHVREAIDATNDAWAAKNHDTLADAMDVIQRHLGRIEIIGEPAGAEVSVNGRPVARLPLAGPVTVSIGQVDIELRAPGYEPGQRTVTIVAGQYQRVVLRLSKEGPPATAAVHAEAESPQVDSPPHEPERPPPTIDVAPKPPRPPVEGPSTARTALKWTAAGLSLASLAVGVTFTIIEGRNVSAFDASGNCANVNGRAVFKGTDTPMPMCQEALDDSILDTKLAVAGYIGAGVFAATWLILQLTEPSPMAPAAESALSPPACAPLAAGRMGLSCVLRF